MSNAEPNAESWPVLPIRERRVLGVLIEKQKTSKSPDAYPMSVNAITTGCNQKSNRDPVLDLDEDDVEETLTHLQGGGWVSKITGGRVERWRHLLYENWKVDRIQLAILAELLLRGPQSEGDLRTRVCRMDDVPDLDQLRALLKPLAERKLVVYLTPPERRGTTLTHGFHESEELQAIAAAVGRGVVESTAINVEGRSSLAEEVARLREEVRELREWVLELRAAKPS